MLSLQPCWGPLKPFHADFNFCYCFWTRLFFQKLFQLVFAFHLCVFTSFSSGIKVIWIHCFCVRWAPPYIFANFYNFKWILLHWMYLTFTFDWNSFLEFIPFYLCLLSFAVALQLLLRAFRGLAVFFWRLIDIYQCCHCMCVCHQLLFYVWQQLQ